MNALDRLLAGLLWLLGALAIAGIIHIAAIFALPGYAAKKAYARLDELAKPGELTLLPPPGPETQFMPFADPAMVQAVCLYDLAQGPLRLHAGVKANRLLTISFRTPDGKVFYSLTDLAAQQNKIDVVVLTPAQLEVVEADDDEDNPTQDLRLLAPEQQGFIFLNALAAYPGERADAEARIKSASCSSEPLAQD